VAQQTGGKLNNLILATVVIAVAFLILDRFTNFSGMAAGEEAGKQLSVAVLPFENMGSEEDAYFAAGVTEDILTQLSKIGSLRVLSPFTFNSYKPEGKTVEQIGKELGVDYLLVGSIRKAGEELRITCRLVQVNPEQQTWADKYDRRMENIFAIQGQVAEEVARSLRVSLSKTEKTQIAQLPTQNIAAYNVYLKGREAFKPFSSEGFQQAAALFKQAIEMDPSFGLAHADLAVAWSNSCHYGTLP
jgi:TolB-like protein